MMQNRRRVQTARRRAEDKIYKSLNFEVLKMYDYFI